MDNIDDKPETQESGNLFYEMLLEDLKNIESSSKLILDLIAPIYRSSTQARGLLEAIKKESKDSENQKFYTDGKPKAWSNALSAMRDGADGRSNKKGRSRSDRQ